MKTDTRTCTHLDTISEIIVKIENVLEVYFDSGAILLVYHLDNILVLARLVARSRAIMCALLISDQPRGDRVNFGPKHTQPALKTRKNAAAPANMTKRSKETVERAGRKWRSREGGRLTHGES